MKIYHFMSKMSYFRKNREKNLIKISPLQTTYQFSIHSALKCTKKVQFDASKAKVNL